MNFSLFINASAPKLLFLGLRQIRSTTVCGIENIENTYLVYRLYKTNTRVIANNPGPFISC